MSKSEEPIGEIATGERANADFNADLRAESASRRASGATTERATDSVMTRPRITLAAGVTCPDCGLTSKAEWMTKSRQGDAYATTVFCEGCGCLIAVLTGRVEARVVAHQQEL